MQKTLERKGARKVVSSAVIFAAGAMLLSSCAREPELELPSVVRVRVEAGKTYLDGCFRGIGASDPNDTSWANQKSSLYGTVTLNTVPDNDWTFSYWTANGKGSRTNLPLSRLGNLITEETSEPVVLSDRNGNLQKRVVCRQTLRPGVVLDEKYNGQFLANVVYDGERTPTEHVVGNVKKALGPVNSSTHFVSIPGMNPPVGYHETKVGNMPSRLEEVMLSPIMAVPTEISR